MDHNVIKRVIFDQIEVIKNSEIIDRDYTFEKNIYLRSHTPPTRNSLSPDSHTPRSSYHESTNPRT